MSPSDVLDRFATVLPGERLGEVQVSGVGPGGAPEARPLAAPVGDEEWSEVLARAKEEGLAVLLQGHGSKLGWCHPPERVDVVLTTREDKGVTAYEPEDGTLTARAGTTMEELARAIAENGHHLTPDVPNPGGATLGGVIASGAAGIDRLRHGPVRHAVLGLRAGLADGTAVKSGGALVKNVTGYDLHRLFTGSHGTLGVVLEASLRLQPAPVEEAHLSLAFDGRADALSAAERVLALPARPLAVVVHGSSGGGATLCVALAGRREVVEWEVERVHEVLPTAFLVRGDEARGVREGLRDSGNAPDRRPTLRLSCRPSKLGECLDGLAARARSLGLEWREELHPGVATASIELASPSSAEELRSLHEAASELEARVAWHDAPHELAGEIDVFGAPSAGLPLMRRLKDALDPEGVFTRGRFHGRI